MLRPTPDSHFALPPRIFLLVVPILVAFDLGTERDLLEIE